MESEPDSPWSDGASVAIEQQAADWLVQRDRGLTAEQQAGFESWLRQDERHAEVFAELEETWRLMGQAETSKPSEDIQPNPIKAVRPKGRAVWFTVTLAAAAAVAFAVAPWRRGADAPEEFVQ